MSEADQALDAMLRIWDGKGNPIDIVDVGIQPHKKVKGRWVAIERRTGAHVATITQARGWTIKGRGVLHNNIIQHVRWPYSLIATVLNTRLYCVHSDYVSLPSRGWRILEHR